MSSELKSYNSLNKQVYVLEKNCIVPLRFEDRYLIMKWRNEQLYHLRQNKPLTIEDQDKYFFGTISKLFEMKYPDQILFSYLENEICIGYGGLVHINWQDSNAEISFIMDTKLESSFFEAHWMRFLKMIQEVAFEQLSLYKIYTYAFDLRPRLFATLKMAGFGKDAILKEHAMFEGKPIDVHIDCKFNRIVNFVLASSEDLKITFEWAINPEIRKYSINRKPITWSEHQTWFLGKVQDSNCLFHIVYYQDNKIGTFRLDIKPERAAWISYLLSPDFHGKGLGRSVLEKGIQIAKKDTKIDMLLARVYKGNLPSLRLFEKLGFELIESRNDIMTFKLSV